MKSPTVEPLPLQPSKQAPPKSSGWMPPRFCVAWLMPLTIGLGAWHSPFAAWAVLMVFQLGLAAVELLPVGRHSPPAVAPRAWHPLCLRIHVLLQTALLVGVLELIRSNSQAGQGIDGVGLVALGLAVGGVTGSLGITFAHELGHSRSKFDRVLAWWLMASVNYSHFMVEHYRGHHAKAATLDDPASARRGESLWRFLPRTLSGSWRSAWHLEAKRLQQRGRNGLASPLAWATAGQGMWLVVVAAVFGVQGVVFWIVQSAYAVFLLEAINYIEHYGLQRASVNGRREPFTMHHAWNADHRWTNAFLANLQRHSDHHLHAWKPYPSLEALPGPQLPTGYAGSIWLAMVPPLWFRVMHPRMPALQD